MREFLDSILEFIVTTSLTDDEFETVESTFQLYDQSTYDDLARILKTRESVSIYLDRLTFYYQARGANINPEITAASNIYIGSSL